MNFEELVAVLNRTNHERANPVNESLIRDIVALVMKNPLDEDRALCQERIRAIVFQTVKGEEHAD